MTAHWNRFSTVFCLYWPNRQLTLYAMYVLVRSCEAWPNRVTSESRRPFSADQLRQKSDPDLSLESPPFHKPRWTSFLTSRSTWLGHSRDTASPLRVLGVEIRQDFGGDSMDREIDRLWQIEVAPALVEIEDTLSDHSFVHELARSTAQSTRDLVVSGAALAVAVATVGHLAASLSAAAGVAGAAAQATASSALNRLDSNRQARRRDFYYLQQLARFSK